MFFHAWEALAVNTLSPGLKLLSSLLYVIDMSAFTDLEPDTDTNKQLKASDNNFRRDSRNCRGLFYPKLQLYILERVAWVWWFGFCSGI